MSIFNDDRATLNEAAMALDEAITQSGMDNAVKKAFEERAWFNSFPQAQAMLQRHTLNTGLTSDYEGF